jgi:predicted 3-demethylubiquinone-9 3-methyltransferase (glyoxalase superfamily)
MARPRIAPCLWFDHEAQDAANFYVSLFERSRVDRTTPYGEGGMGPPGSVMLVEFTLAGLGFQALNGGPMFRFSEAVSLSVDCESQAEVDRLWDALGAGGEPGPCGWIKDRYGLSWQIVPQALIRMMQDTDSARVSRVVSAMLTMTRLDIAALEQAFAG